MPATALALSAGAVAAWLAILLMRGRPWRLWPRESDLGPPPEPAAWPRVRVVVPARNEAATLPATLPALLGQDYPGEFEVVVVDDRSEDGTAAVAEAIATRLDRTRQLRVVRGAALPPGWAGKPWALAQGCAAPGPAPMFLLFTDADIHHAPRSLATLVAEALAADLVLDSRMARLRCRSRSERLLIPAYLYFFNLLYPMPRANDPRDRLAAAAGGCVLVRSDALHAAGGVDSIRDCLIDDIALARLMKRHGAATRLALAEDTVTSLRVYDEDDTGRSTAWWRGDVWRMVRRSAFTELRHSWALLGVALLLLLFVFVLPLGLVALAVAGDWSSPVTPAVLALGGLGSCAAMAASYLPVLRYFGLPTWRVVTLPLAALAFGAMTLDSGLVALRTRASDWR